MKKLLFLLLQAFLCLGSAKDAGPSSLGRGYGAGNYAVSAQSSLSGDQKARLADVIYLTGVGPMIYQDFIKFWDGQKVGDFLQSVVHLAQQYPAGVDCDQYWTEIFTYLLEREPQLYEALKRFPRVSGFINANAGHFDKVVERAKENKSKLSRIAQQIVKNAVFSAGFHPLWQDTRVGISVCSLMEFAEFAKANNVNIRDSIKVKYKLDEDVTRARLRAIQLENDNKEFNIIEKAFKEHFNGGGGPGSHSSDCPGNTDIVNELLNLGYISPNILGEDYSINRNADFRNFKIFLNHGFLKFSDIRSLLDSYIYNYNSTSEKSLEARKRIALLAASKVKQTATLDVIDTMKQMFQSILENIKRGKVNLYNKEESYKFFDILSALNLLFPNDFLNYDVIKDVYGSQKQIAFLENFLIYLKNNNIKHKIPDNTLKRLEDFANYDDNARRRITEFIRKEYKKDGDSWIRTDQLERQKSSPGQT